MRNNTAVRNRLAGSRVHYGDEVQLRHVHSGKFLCLTANASSTLDKGHHPALLQEGSEAAHLCLLPRYRLRRLGEPIQTVDQLLLVQVRRVPRELRLALHTSAIRSPDLMLLEVNASSNTQMRWRMLVFDSHIHSGPRASAGADVTIAAPKRGSEGTGGTGLESLRVGECVRLLHVETGCVLALDTALGTGMGMATDTSWQTADSSSSDGSGSGTGSSSSEEEDSSGVTTEGGVCLMQHNYQEQAGNGNALGMGPSFSEEDVARDSCGASSALSLWELEQQGPIGGTIHWGSSYRLRHLCSGS